MSAILITPEAKECGELIFGRMIKEEEERRANIQRPKAIERIRREIAAENPYGYLVTTNIFKAHKTLAALACGGFDTVEEAPEGLIALVTANQRTFGKDAQEHEATVLIDPRTAYSYGIYLLTQEAYVDAFAHQFELVGKTSLQQYQEGDN